MPLMYKPTKHAFFTEGEELTEQEHKDSCDINKMVKSAMRGLPVRGSKLAPWGEEFLDDTTMDAVQHRILKEKTERELTELAKSEFLPHELEAIPKSIREKFGFKKLKQVQEPKPAKNNDDLNDDEKRRSSEQNKAEKISPQQNA